jgi:hypothetical protein
MKSDTQLLVEAIRNLKPTSEFVITDGDYSTIEWHVLEGTAPTKAQVTAEITKIKAADVTAEAEHQASKAALLARLGITEDEAKLLLS